MPGDQEGNRLSRAPGLLTGNPLLRDKTAPRTVQSTGVGLKPPPSHGRTRGPHQVGKRDGWTPTAPALPRMVRPHTAEAPGLWFPQWEKGAEWQTPAPRHCVSLPGKPTQSHCMELTGECVGLDSWRSDDAGEEAQDSGKPRSDRDGLNSYPQKEPGRSPSQQLCPLQSPDDSLVCTGYSWTGTPGCRPCRPWGLC